jgi:hypothetical protein
MEREWKEPPIVLALRDTDADKDDGSRIRKLRALLKSLKREWRYRCEGFSIPQTTPIMQTPGEGI